MHERRLDTVEKYRVLIAAIQAIAQLPEAHPETGAAAIRIARIAMEEAEIPVMTVRPSQLH